MKDENPSYSICEVAKELGRRWAEMDPSIKQRYQARAEEERQKYDVDMASYRQGTFEHGDRTAPSPGGPGGGGGGQASPIPSPQQQQQHQQQQQQQQQQVFEVRGQAVTTQDYANLLQ